MKVYRRKRGDILQSARFPWPVVAGLKMKAREWANQYQQQPSPETGNIFNPSWWRYYKADALPEFDLVVLSVDCAFKSGKENDLVAIHKWGMVGPRSYLIERQTEHLGYVATKAAIRSMQLHGRAASTIIIEDKANGSAIVEELKSDADFGAAVIAVNPQGDKKSRAHAASTDCEAGNVYLPENAEWLGTFLRTAAAFPAVRFDDDIDAMSQFLNWRRGRSMSLGVVDYFKQIASGARKAVTSVQQRLVRLARKPEGAAVEESKPPAIVTRDQWKEWTEQHRAPACPDCGPPPDGNISSTTWLGSNIHCNSCGIDFTPDGKVLRKPAEIVIGVNCCGDAIAVFKETGRPHKQVIGNEIQCTACHRQSGHRPEDPQPRGMSRKEYFRSRGQFAIRADVGYKNTFGRFG
jgi:predicted phage terminase large subunit-like protein